jgi:hypothetical protein
MWWQIAGYVSLAALGLTAVLVSSWYYRHPERRVSPQRQRQINEFVRDYRYRP